MQYITLPSGKRVLNFTPKRKVTRIKEFSPRCQKHPERDCPYRGRGHEKMPFTLDDFEQVLHIDTLNQYKILDLISWDKAAEIIKFREKLIALEGSVPEQRSSKKKPLRV